MQMLFFVYSGNISDVRIYNNMDNLYHIDFTMKDSSYSLIYSGKNCLEIEKKLINK